jgi:hypothetical protein
MTSEDEARIRDLPHLIAEEKNNEKAVLMAAELRDLLTRRAKELILGAELKNLLTRRPSETSTRG